MLLYKREASIFFFSLSLSFFVLIQNIKLYWALRNESFTRGIKQNLCNVLFLAFFKKKKQFYYGAQKTRFSISFKVYTKKNLTQHINWGITIECDLVSEREKKRIENIAKKKKTGSS